MYRCIGSLFRCDLLLDFAKQNVDLGCHIQLAFFAASEHLTTLSFSCAVILLSGLLFLLLFTFSSLFLLLSSALPSFSFFNFCFERIRLVS